MSKRSRVSQNRTALHSHCVARDQLASYEAFGPQGLFLQNAYVHTAVAAVALWRRIATPNERRRP